MLTEVELNGQTRPQRKINGQEAKDSREINMKLITRSELAKRWCTSERTVDRRRKDGLIPWLDIAGGRGKRPLVRFRLEDIEDYEMRMMQKAVSRVANI